MKPWKVALAGFILLAWFGIDVALLESVFVIGVPVLFTGAGVLAISGAVALYRRGLYVRDLPTSTARSAAAGLVEIEGRVVPAGETVPAPFSRRESVLCQYSVRKPPPTGSKDRPSILPLDHGLVGVPFYVEDETGRILVRPDGADVRIPDDLFELDAALQSTEADELAETPRRTHGSGSAEEAPLSLFEAERAEWYERFGLTDRLKGLVAVIRRVRGGDRHRPFPARSLQYAEVRLEPGDRVYVLGHAHPPSPDSAGEEGAAEESSDGSSPVIREAPDRSASSGVIGRYVARLLSVEKFLALGSDYRSIFVIASEPEEELISSWNGRVWKQLIAGFAVFGLGLLGVLLAVGYIGSA